MVREISTPIISQFSTQQSVNSTISYLLNQRLRMIRCILENQANIDLGDSTAIYFLRETSDVCLVDTSFVFD